MVFAHNQHVAQGCNASPFFLMMGYNLWAIPTVVPPTNVSTVKEHFDNLWQAPQKAEAAHELAQQWMAEWITKDFTPVKEGQQVWLDSKNLQFFQDHKKLWLKWQGPYKITEVLGPLTYQLQLPPQ